MAKPSRWFISDRAIERPEQDEFGHVDVAAQLADIVETVQAPATIGLLGGFGTGKSSIGNLLAGRLATHDRFQVVTLSGERHTGIARQRALVYSFAEALQEDAGVRRKDVERVLGKIEAGEDLEQPDLASLPLATFLMEHRGTLLRAIGWALLAGAVMYLAGVLAAFLVNAVREDDVNILAAPFRIGYLAVLVVAFFGTFLIRILEPWITASLSPGRRTRRRPRAEAADELERVFGDLAGLCPKKLVIVVDDIDRLPPEEVLEALATIKSLQAVPKKHPPIFIIACDDEVVRRAIQTADPGLSSVGGSQQKAAEEYLNKLFLVRQPLPPPLREDMTSFAEKLLSAPETNHAGLGALGGSASGVLEVLIHEGVTDPRHVVRLLNAFFADYRLAMVREGGAGRLASESVTGAPLTLARLTVLRVDFPYAYAAVRDEYDLLNALDAHVLGGTLDQSQRNLIERANLVVMARVAERDGASGDDEQSEEARDERMAGTARPRELPPDLAAFLRRTARYVEQAVPLGPFFYLSQTGAGRILGSRRAEEIRLALENNDVETVRSRLTDDESIAHAAVDHVIATLGSSRPGLPLTNSTATATSCLGSVPEARRSELAAKIAEIIGREPEAAPAPAGLADLIRFAPEIYRPGLVGRLVAFDADEDAASSRAEVSAELAVELPGEDRLTEALAAYFASLPRHSGYAEVHVWVPRAAKVDPLDLNRIFGPDFYSAIIGSAVGAQDDSIPSEEMDAFTALLGGASEDVKSSQTVLDSVRGGLAAEGVEPRWFAMRSLELLVIRANDVPDVLARVSRVCISEEVAPYGQTLASAMRIIASLARDHTSELAAMSGDGATEVVAAVTVGVDRASDATVQIEAARALEYLSQVWASDLAPAVDALATGMESHRSSDDETGRAIQAALLSLIARLPADSGEKAAEALMSPIAVATDQNDPGVRMAIEATRDACRSEQGRTYVGVRVPAWRQVFQAAINAHAQVRPQAEALRIAAEHNAFMPAEQQELVTRLAALVVQGHPSVEVAAETLAAIPWDESLRSQAGEALADAWDEVEDDVRRRVVHDLTLWPDRELPPHTGLIDKVVQFVVASDDETREDLLTKLWSWFSSSNRASVLASGVSTQFRRIKLRDADIDELYETLVAASRTPAFSDVVDDLNAVHGDSTSAAAVRFIEASLTDEGLGWNDDHVRAATVLVSDHNAADLATAAMSELSEGAVRAGHAASLIAWLRPRRSDRLDYLHGDLKEAIFGMLPQADADLAGRLGHASSPIAKRLFGEVLKHLRADKENQRSRSAADAFESGRSSSY